MIGPRGRLASARRVLVIASAIAVGTMASARPQGPAQVPAARLAAREWFRDAKFGMFVHWGVYSQLGQGEWVMQNQKLPIAPYEWLASNFNPVKFDAQAWVAMAKAAGARYITITSRHHDGFSMFQTRATQYNIVDWTPFKRDPMKELADECRKQGLKLFFYYSQLDWHHPDYFPRGGTGGASGRPDAGDWNRYLDFMDQQLTELLTNYGPIGGIWFDGMWDKPNANWRLDRTYALIHRLQPAALIVPNHHKAPLPGEDVQTFEQDLPGGNTAGFNTREIGTLPLETSLTMNTSWGFNIADGKFKSTQDLIGFLVRAAGNGANLLLNVGPRPDGTIQPEAVTRLQEIGAWLQRYGVSIYGTRKGPVAPQPWGATTRKDTTVYVHVLDSAAVTVTISARLGSIGRATMLSTSQRVDFTQSNAGTTIRLPAASAAEIDRV
ncbi:MAG TPA: alpha-L-fucosidase, partial [Vicinamibacterales bacterium]|nr:alpha-L-fucosidase [Vicinamibacterales bacterium]